MVHRAEAAAGVFNTSSCLINRKESHQITVSAHTTGRQADKSVYPTLEFSYD